MNRTVQLENELFLYKKMVDASIDSISLIDRNYTYRIVTNAFIEARKLKREKILNHTVADVWGEEVFEQVIKKKLDECFNGKTISHTASYEFNKNEINYIETIYTPCFISDSETSYAVVISHNITELKKSQDKIRQLAYYDSLTKLPSRPLFFDLLGRELKRANRTGKLVAVLFFDLDEFKRINDSYGHSAGDKVLAAVSNRLKRYLRQHDIIGRPGEIIKLNNDKTSEYLARVGGDEFTLIIPDLNDKMHVSGIAARILNLFNEPFEVLGQEIFISTSIGASFYPDDGKDVESLMKNADAAMYKAKERGKNTIEYYSPEINKKTKERIYIENKLRYAIVNHDFYLLYQPQYSIATNQLTGAEALIRWKDKELGIVSPKDFISIAEEIGIIIEIGNWVIQKACMQGKRWHDLGLNYITMGVNLSVKQFYDPHLIETIKTALNNSGFDPAFLELEITETAMIRDTDKAMSTMEELKKLGIKIVLDDFGTGYSSLVHLKLFPVDAVKIDQMFIRNADLKGKDGAIISSIIDMGHRLQIKVVAEGVETMGGLEFLKKNKCNLAQGFFFNPPLSSKKFEDELIRPLMQDI